MGTRGDLLLALKSAVNVKWVPPVVPTDAALSGISSESKAHAAARHIARCQARKDEKGRLRTQLGRIKPRDVALLEEKEVFVWETRTVGLDEQGTNQKLWEDIQLETTNGERKHNPGK